MLHALRCRAQTLPQVQAALKRHWAQYRFRCKGPLAPNDSHSNCHTSVTEMSRARGEPGATETRPPTGARRQASQWGKAMANAAATDSGMRSKPWSPPSSEPARTRVHTRHAHTGMHKDTHGHTHTQTQVHTHTHTRARLQAYTCAHYSHTHTGHCWGHSCSTVLVLCTSVCKLLIAHIPFQHPSSIISSHHGPARVYFCIERAFSVAHKYTHKHKYISFHFLYTV